VSKLVYLVVVMMRLHDAIEVVIFEDMSEVVIFEDMSSSLSPLLSA
jgi:hypothetical protein